MVMVMVMIERPRSEEIGGEKDEEGQEDDQDGDALQRAKSEPRGEGSNERKMASRPRMREMGEGGKALWGGGSGGSATRKIKLKEVWMCYYYFCYYYYHK